MLRRISIGVATLLIGAALTAALVRTPEVQGAHRGFVVTRGIDYDLGSPPRPPSTPDMNRLDVYRPRGLLRANRRHSAQRPLVVWIHPGGWRRGDKRIGVGNKAELFTGAGYVFASINYRLSAAPFDPRDPDPDRVRFPAQPHDVGEAIGWLYAHAGRFGIDRRKIILIGHSAGAHLATLVATDPRYVRAYGVPPRDIAGFVALDAPAFNIAAAADPSLTRRPAEGREMLWNAFGTPRENELTNDWTHASPVHFAGPEDPPALLVTQAGNMQRAVDYREMALALGRDPDQIVLPLPLDHREIGRYLGSPDDQWGETQAVAAFVRGVTLRRRHLDKRRDLP